jgi:hypothetical protein
LWSAGSFLKMIQHNLYGGLNKIESQPANPRLTSQKINLSQYHTVSWNAFLKD